MLELRSNNQNITFLCFSGWAHNFSWINKANSSSRVLELSNKDIFKESNLGDDGCPKFDFLLKRKSPFVLIGWSLGGMLCLDFLRQFPGLVKALILISSTSQFAESGEQKENFLVSKKRMKLFKESFDSQPEITAANFYRDIHSKKNNLDYFFKENFSNDLKAPLSAGLSYLQSKNLSPYLSEIKTKTLILHGDKDKLIKKEASEFLNNNLKDSKLEIIPNIGHDLPYSGSSKINREIETFLEKV